MSKENTNGGNASARWQAAKRLHREFQHLRSDWWWLLLYGVLLTVCGTVAIVLPPLGHRAACMIVLGVVLMVGGIATIITVFWAGKVERGLLVQLLVGVLYLVVGFAICDLPVTSALIMTMFIAALFIVVGGFACWPR